MNNTPESFLTPHQSVQTTPIIALFIVASGLMTMVLGIILLTRGRFTQLLIDFGRPCPFLTGLSLSIYLPLSLVLIALATLVIEYSSQVPVRRHLECNSSHVVTRVACDLFAGNQFLPHSTSE